VKRINDKSRKGDLGEYYAVTWLWDNGYEVFKNTGCSGPIDLIAIKNGKTTFVDVKSMSINYTKRKENKIVYANKRVRTKAQKKLDVRFLAFNPMTRKLKWVKHDK
jgi:Holliday junction resolvase-like predicted endonuclease